MSGEECVEECVEGCVEGCVRVVWSGVSTCERGAREREGCGLLP